MPSRAEIAAFLAMQVAAEANRRSALGQDIVRFDVGQPAFGAPAAVIAAAQRALGEHQIGYTEALGLPRLREAIAGWYRKRAGVAVPAEQVVITVGASGAFALAFLALLQDGDRVAMAAPGYPPYRHILTALGFRPAIALAEAADRFQLTPAHLRTLSDEGPVRAALIASPANPTGTMLDAERLAALAAACRAQDITLISDEIYHGLTYEAEAQTALAFDSDAIIVNSFSKYWAMTGWRVGWLIAPARLIPAIERLAQNLFISPPTLAQIAACAAFEPESIAECEARRTLYAQNRARLLEALPGLRLPILAPADGAFYALIDITAHADDSLAWCAKLLERAGVALTPGVDFCADRGRRWARLAFARSPEEVEAGLSRLRVALAG